MQCLFMSLATTIGYWAVASWIPSYAETVARNAGEANPGRWSAIVGIVYNCGAIVGYLAGGFLADIIGRRGVLAAFFGGSILTTPLLYLWADTPTAVVLAAGLKRLLFTLGQFVWIAIYPAELFPTAVRATAMSMVFDTSRFISFLGPLVAGLLITRIGGYGTTAMLFSSLYVVALVVSFIYSGNHRQTVATLTVDSMLSQWSVFVIKGSGGARLASTECEGFGRKSKGQNRRI